MLRFVDNDIQKEYILYILYYMESVFVVYVSSLQQFEMESESLKQTQRESENKTVVFGEWCVLCWIRIVISFCSFIV